MGVIIKELLLKQHRYADDKFLILRVEKGKYYVDYCETSGTESIAMDIQTLDEAKEMFLEFAWNMI